jgi:hypothetical protein
LIRCHCQCLLFHRHLPLGIRNELYDNSASNWFT